MRQDYVDAIRALLPYIPPECFAVILGQVLAGAELSKDDQELVAKIHERAAVSRARRVTAYGMTCKERFGYRPSQP